MSKKPIEKRICENCHKEYQPTGYRQKYCKDCKLEVERRKSLERWKKNGRPQYSNDKWEKCEDGKWRYKKHGYNQKGENNNNYKNGIGTYNKKAFENQEHCCSNCGATENLLVHHKDEDRTNNDLSNLTILCKKCHQEHHMERDKENGRFIGKKEYKE